jgi:Tfp pilus assembly PilM family ATPase
MSGSSKPSMLTRWLSSRPPSAALEIDARRVTAVAIAGRGSARVLSGYATEPLPAGAVEPALNAPNVHDAAALSRAIRAALEKLSPHPRRIALVLPDTVAKVSLLRFEKIPPKGQDLEQLIRWQIRKAAPFKIEDAQISWLPGVALPEGGREFVVSAARRDIIESYERACEGAGVHAGIVDMTTMNLVNAVIAASASSGDPSTGSGTRGDWLLVHVAADYVTLAVVRGRDLIFFRNRVTDADEDVAAFVHQTSMYHEDRLGGGAFSRVILGGASARAWNRSTFARPSRCATGLPPAPSCSTRSRPRSA